MTDLRTTIAVEAMKAFITQPGRPDRMTRDIARLSYAMAEEMLAEQNKSPQDSLGNPIAPKHPSMKTVDGTPGTSAIPGSVTFGSDAQDGGDLPLSEEELNKQYNMIPVIHLMNQAKAAIRLKAENESLRKRTPMLVPESVAIVRLSKLIIKLETALKFYADGLGFDDGDMARKALKDE